MTYNEKAQLELTEWKTKMMKEPSFTGELSRKLQMKVNKVIPEKIHQTITTAIKNMTQAVLFGAEFTNPEPLLRSTLEDRERLVTQRIQFYSKTAATEGAITGAGGILLGLADFPLWLTLKLKMLFEIAALYGMNTGSLKERVFMLYIFQLTFSTQRERNRIIGVLDDWQNFNKQLPYDINDFDWRKFQQEYRDYIDIAKLLQLVPGIGAPIGAIVNYSLTKKLGNTAMNAYRLRNEKAPIRSGLS
jgi:hypothetical protein